jgi:hypothetical protein
MVDRGKRLWSGRAGCTNCHGWAGNGDAREPFPPGADLRVTALHIDALAEVIACGRPATGMPHYDKAAYTDTRCYGVTEADLGSDKPPGGASLRASEILAIATYIAARIKDRGEITKDECIEYFGQESDCAAY